MMGGRRAQKVPYSAVIDSIMVSPLKKIFLLIIRLFILLYSIKFAFLFMEKAEKAPAPPSRQAAAGPQRGKQGDFR
ncbi:MAG: hypothetical protein II774_03885, partial [Lachnospiraceae bacterium]|nr:hypothetical protein [Lachnospiraceae bacterium]